MSADLLQLNWDFLFTMKNESKKASGAPEMEQLFQKKHQLPNSNLEAIMEIPQIQISKSLLQTNVNEKNSSLLSWLNSSLPTSINPLSPHLSNHLCWLLKCHKSQQLPLELQQAYWPELLELEYPAEIVQEPPVILCKKESQVKLKKTAFSHEKSRKSQKKQTFPLTFHD